MKKVLRILFLFPILLSCSPRFEYVIIKKGYRPSNSEIATLSDAEIAEVELLIQECVPGLSRSFRRYRYQLVPYINEEGEKMVWVNAFCSKEKGSWKEDVVIVFDGGDCYFNLTLNLTDHKCESLIVNGES